MGCSCKNISKKVLRKQITMYRDALLELSAQLDDKCPFDYFQNGQDIPDWCSFHLIGPDYFGEYEDSCVGANYGDCWANWTLGKAMIPEHVISHKFTPKRRKNTSFTLD